MNTDTNRLLELAYEIEGLLLLADRRGNETPEQIWQIIANKAETIRQSVSSCESDSAFPEAVHTPIFTDDDERATESDKDHAGPESHVCDDVFSLDELEVKPECHTDTAEKDDENALTEDKIHEIDDIEEKMPLQTVEAMHPAESDKQPQADIVDTSIDEEKTEASDRQETLDPEIPDDELPVDDETGGQPITLDEKLAREQSRCLRKAFSLNDRFRFRRELFGNSDTEFADALNMLEAMETLAEANEYFYEDLQWDPENPEVIDFMQIVTKHFQGR